MKLYKVPNGSMIKLKGDSKEKAIHPPDHRDFVDGEVLKFSFVDGMYSYCTDRNGRVVHLNASADVTVLKQKDFN